MRNFSAQHGITFSYPRVVCKAHQLELALNVEGAHLMPY
jgi:hypothetical protein